jgi:hypothetical protein
VDTIEVKDLDQIKIYTPIISTAAGKTKYVYTYDKMSKAVKLVEKVTLPVNISSVQYQKTTDNYGEVITKTNDIQLLITEKPELKTVLSTIDIAFAKNISASTQSIVVSEQKYSTEYKAVIAIDNQLQTITVIKQNNQFKVIAVSALPQTISSAASIAPAYPSQPVPTSGETATLLNNVIGSSTMPVLKDATIVSINSTDTYLNTVYTVKTLTKANNIQIVTIVSEPDKTPEVVYVQNENPPAISSATEASTTTVQTSQLTGNLITITTDQTNVINQTDLFLPAIVKVIPQVSNYQPISVKTTDIGTSTWTTIVFGGSKDSIQVTSVLNTTTGNITVIDNKTLELNSSVTNAVPITQIYTISSSTIAITAQKVPAISKIMN